MNTDLDELNLLGLSSQALLLASLTQAGRVQPSQPCKTLGYLLGPSRHALQPCRGEPGQPVVILGLLMTHVMGMMSLQHADLSEALSEGCCKAGHVLSSQHD